MAALIWMLLVSLSSWKAARSPMMKMRPIGFRKLLLSAISLSSPSLICTSTLSRRST